MVHTILLQSPSITSFTPPSPDPTPLRMLAFSVAEAALQQDPNSPMFASDDSMPAQDPWGCETKSRFSRWNAEPQVTQSIASRRGKPLWEMVDKARDRREKERSSPSTIDSPLPTSPISPNSYTFVLPSNSHLAASVAGGAAAPSKHGLTMPVASPTKHYPFPLYTRSAEPSPTKSTFCALDQTRPPPEFVPRLSAKEFAEAHPVVPAAKSPSQRLQAQATSRLSFPSRHAPNGNSKLPSLAEIQQKIKNGNARNGHRRNGSAGSMPRVTRSDSESSCELITTPDEEINRFNLVILNDNDRSPSPPVESRLAPFLRQRTSGRLVHAPRPLSMPPISYEQVFYGEKPSFTITPPSATPSVPPPSARAAPTPVRPVFATPLAKLRSTSLSRSDSPSSPTDSARSPSPTLSIPIITCTPAQQGDSDSDSESEADVIVFDGEVEEAKERQERERRGRAMKDMLLSRRRSLQ